jgi:ATP-binding cassette subfamily A (ABC1) protein 5
MFTNGLLISGIKKTYQFYPFGINSKKDVKAVNGIYLHVPKNELLCLLGHNGAGKSTLFNIMSGLIGQTEGQAKIYGYDITDEQDQIRKILGIVPQFDALWDFLTAKEHMIMFCKIKGVPSKFIM